MLMKKTATLASAPAPEPVPETPRTDEQVAAIERSERIESLIAEGMTQDEALAIVDGNPAQVAALEEFAEMAVADFPPAVALPPEPEPVVEMAASDIPAPMSIPEPVVAIAPAAAVDIDADPKKSELEEAQAELGIGGRIEIEAHGFRVMTGARPPQFGHGITIEAALYDLKNPGKLQPTVGKP